MSAWRRFSIFLLVIGCDVGFFANQSSAALSRANPPVHYRGSPRTYSRKDAENIIAHKSCQDVRSEQAALFEKRGTKPVMKGEDLAELFAIEAFACDASLQEWP